MKTVVVIAYCDPDADQNPDDEPVPATAEITYNGTVLDVCERHRVIVQGMLDELAQVFSSGSPIKDGRRPTRTGPAPGVKSMMGTRPSPALKNSVAWRTCPECGHLAPTRSANGQHLKQRHDSRLGDYEWPTE